MFERIHPKGISWLSTAAFGPSSGLLGNSVSKSGHCQPRSIITTNSIDASLECVGLFLGESWGHLRSCSSLRECTVSEYMCQSAEGKPHRKYICQPLSVLQTNLKSSENCLFEDFALSAALQSSDFKHFSKTCNSLSTDFINHPLWRWKCTFQPARVVTIGFSKGLKAI